MPLYPLDSIAQHQLELEQIRPDDLFYIKAYYSRIGLSLPESKEELDRLMLNRELQSFCLGFWEAINNKLDDNPERIMSPVGREPGSLSDFNRGVVAGLEYKEKELSN